jgi:hypothetical protein
MYVSEIWGEICADRVLLSIHSSRSPSSSGKTSFRESSLALLHSLHLEQLELTSFLLPQIPHPRRDLLPSPQCKLLTNQFSVFSVLLFSTLTVHTLFPYARVDLERNGRLHPSRCDLDRRRAARSRSSKAFSRSVQTTFQRFVPLLFSSFLLVLC